MLNIYNNIYIKYLMGELHKHNEAKKIIFIVSYKNKRIFNNIILNSLYQYILDNN